jgi:hypothetical protein
MTAKQYKREFNLPLGMPLIEEVFLNEMRERAKQQAQTPEHKAWVKHYQPISVSKAAKVDQKKKNDGLPVCTKAKKAEASRIGRSAYSAKCKKQRMEKESLKDLIIKDSKTMSRRQLKKKYKLQHPDIIKYLGYMA